MGSNLGSDQQGAGRDPTSEEGSSTNSKARESTSGPVPVDLVTTSGGGLDPDISPEAAHFQARPSCEARNLPPDREFAP